MDDSLQPQETQDNDRIIPVNIEEQMKTAYIDYSMSVIVGREFLIKTAVFWAIFSTYVDVVFPSK